MELRNLLETFLAEDLKDLLVAEEEESAHFLHTKECLTT